MAKNKKSKRSFLIVIILTIACFSVYFIIFNKKDNNEILNKIEGYDYFIAENDSSLTKKLYNELNSILSNSEINYEEYAKTISKMFIADLYTLNNKNNKYNVTSKIYFYPEYRDNYSLKVKNTIYKYISSLQEKPEVISIDVTNVETDNISLENKTYDGYLINLKWQYDKDYGYDQSGIVSIIKDNNILYIVSYESEEELWKNF